jgi:hypothetical protein
MFFEFDDRVVQPEKPFFPIFATYWETVKRLAQASPQAHKARVDADIHDPHLFHCGRYHFDIRDLAHGQKVLMAQGIEEVDRVEIHGVLL